tara:strand:+ start:12289 stop:12897 length:609 start_codon:yes stop_codon:yes gene_type:complete
MKKITDKWYVSLFIVPILLTYLTNFLTLPKILSIWEYSIISSLVIIILIFVYEIIKLKKRCNFLDSIPTEEDKKIIKKLLKSIDLEIFEDDVFNQNSWYGYKKEAINNIISFKFKSQLLKNKTRDKHLNSLIIDFNNKLLIFTEYSSTKLYGDSESFYTPLKDSEERKIVARRDCEKMNEMTSNCFKKLEILIEYLKSKKYI